MDRGISRRDLCRAALAAGAASACAALPAVRARRIDVHQHILPPAYVAAVGAAVIGGPSGRSSVPDWSVSSTIEAMDRLGIATAITSLSSPGIPFRDPALARRLARECNEYARQLAADRPGRFGFFATPPLPDIPASLAEIQYALEVLHADGIVLLTNYDGRYLGDTHFAPIFDELHRRKAVVSIHPSSCPCSAAVDTGVPGSSIEYPHETTRTITSLLASGTFSRCPGIRFIVPHAGGTAPYIADRIARVVARQNPQVPDGLPLLRRLYYDVALSLYPQTMAALLKFVPRTQIVFGTDYPFALNGMDASIEGLATLKLDRRTLGAIERGNALSLFPRLGQA